MNHYPDCPDPSALPRLTRRDQATREECPACGQVTYSDDWPSWEADLSYQAAQEDRALSAPFGAAEKLTALLRAKRLDVE